MNGYGFPDENLKFTVTSLSSESLCNVGHFKLNMICQARPGWLLELDHSVPVNPTFSSFESPPSRRLPDSGGRLRDIQGRVTSPTESACT